ncbi:MAG: DNA translocase FtsK [bacterium]|nr:DNA translocase FtsK [bacterium]
MGIRKKKKSKSRAKAKKKDDKKDEEQSMAVPIAVAVGMIIIAMFLLLGGFGAGGSLPTNLFNGVYWLLGYAAYLSPLVLVFLGYHKLRHEEKKIPKDRFFAAILGITFVAVWLYTGLSGSSPSSAETSEGGSVGSALGNLTLSALSQIPATITFFTLSIVAFFLASGVSPRSFLNIFGLAKKEEDTDPLDVQEEEMSDFQLNEGVPVEHKPGRFRSAAEKAPAPVVNQKALTASSDPSWKLPSVDLLEQKQDKADAGDIEGNANLIKESLANFNIAVDMEGANIGPRVTQYTFKPPAGIRLSKITALDNNLALDLAAHSIRIEAPIPGKRAVGIEVPNVKAATVRISSIMQSQEWGGLKSKLGFGIGKDISGSSVIGDLAKMPHLLVAGQTGSGKSVMINTILTSLLYRNSPSELKLILVDPKQVELKPYDDIPHLLAPVITEPEKCISALKWTVAEMERRYKTLSETGVRNIEEYNQKKEEEGMPYIVLVIDELADLMMMAARDVETLIVRVAQKARAVGIHLILATQRPSVDVITGLIKANIPARIAFTVASQVDSRTIIDQVGAEKLLGQGDMLLLTSDMPKPVRVQGAFISDPETHKVVEFIKSQREPNYDDEIVSMPVQLNGRGGIVMGDGGADMEDDMWKDAIQVVVDARKASTSLLQRRLRVGYARAARLIETMEEHGIVSPADGSRPREVLVNSADEVLNPVVESAPEPAEPTAPDEGVYDDMVEEPEPIE